MRRTRWGPLTGMGKAGGTVGGTGMGTLKSDRGVLLKQGWAHGRGAYGQ